MREATAAPIFARLEQGPVSVADLAAEARIGVSTMSAIVGTLAKMGLVKLLET